MIQDPFESLLKSNFEDNDNNNIRKKMWGIFFSSSSKDISIDTNTNDKR